MYFHAPALMFLSCLFVCYTLTSALTFDSIGKEISYLEYKLHL